MTHDLRYHSASATDMHQNIIRAIFSWVILMPVAVMISGKLVAQTVKLSGQRGQLFQINIPKVITIRARNDEVVLGFGLFLVVLTISGISSGQAVYHLVVVQFGIDPGHFNALCVFSSFVAVVVGGLIFLLTRVTASARRRGDPLLRQYNQTIEKLAQEQPRDNVPVDPPHDVGSLTAPEDKS